jgi:hypothetical protein
LIGGAFDEGAVLLATSAGETREFPLQHEAGTFRAVIPALPAGTWSLSLRVGDESVPLAGLRDDIVDKRVAFVLPGAKIDGVTLQPLYLDGNVFAVRATA